MARYTGTGEGPLDPDRDAQPLFIDGYGTGFFRIGGAQYDGSVIVLPGRVLSWPVSALAEAAAESLQLFIDISGQTDLLLLGTGNRMLPVPADIRQACRNAGVSVEPMDTGAAARTFNVLLAEDRRVSAALIAV